MTARERENKDKTLDDRQRRRERHQPLRRQQTRAYLRAVASSPPSNEPAQQITLFGGGNAK